MNEQHPAIKKGQTWKHWKGAEYRIYDVKQVDGRSLVFYLPTRARDQEFQYYRYAKNPEYLTETDDLGFEFYDLHRAKIAPTFEQELGRRKPETFSQKVSCAALWWGCAYEHERLWVRSESNFLYPVVNIEGETVRRFEEIG